MTWLTWGAVLADPTLNALVKRVNKRHPYMGEADLLDIVNSCAKAFRIVADKEKAAKRGKK